MARLTKEQRNFLIRHGVPLSRVFDASGLSKPEHRVTMKDCGFSVAYGVTACGRAGHTLRDRHGHCVQCEPKNLAFQLRYEETAMVYVMQSERTKRVKVGSSLDLESRLRNLNRCFYGGASDWEVVDAYQTVESGRVEYLTQKSLERHRVTGVYYFDGREIESNELFKCRATVASRALIAAMQELGIEVER